VLLSYPLEAATSGGKEWEREGRRREARERERERERRREREKERERTKRDDEVEWKLWEDAEREVRKRVRDTGQLRTDLIPKRESERESERERGKSRERGERRAGGERGSTRQ